MSAPNIVFLLPDQLRPDFLGCYGATFLHTPAIDGLAAGGARWETAISPSPICVPARASMLTGQHAHATGVIDNLAWLRPDRHEMGVKTWPEHLNEAGYRTAAVGKMHFYPWDSDEGFQTRIIAEDKRHIHIADDYDAALAARGFTKRHARDFPGYADSKGATVNDLPDDLQVDRWVANQAAEWIARQDGTAPFALMVGFPGPHCPYDPPADALARIDPDRLPPALPPTDEAASHRDAFIATYRRAWADLDYSTLSDAEIRGLRHHYAALVERLDADVARILDALAQSGQLENTIVVFASDHGDYLGDFGLVGKTYFHDPSIRVPLIVRDFRRNAAPSVHAGPVSLLDLYSSFLEWAGIEVPANASGLPLSQPAPGRVICGVTSHGMMARDDAWKLVRYANDTEALFDLRNDPGEQVNALTLHPDQRRRLDAALASCLLDGLRAAHADKRVPAAQAAPDHGFYQRGWQRPYPNAK
ncbi:sulfatase family protein [Oceaniglobus trochenteri]|uniref:sulfatase family protein n=1 Tax=Oceaniglobus trochenteri TaxID=2763260 RepID=UPI001CFFA2C5